MRTSPELRPALLVLFAATLSCGRAPRGQSPRAEGDRSTVAVPAPTPKPVEPPAPASDVFVVARSIDIHASASPTAPRLGSARAGARLPLATAEPAGRDGCPGGWVALRPAGFVCEAEGVTTRDAAAPAVRVLSSFRLDARAALPASYGFADSTPVYVRIPTYDEQTISEPNLAQHLRKHAERLKTPRGPGDATIDDRDAEPVGVEVPDDLRGGAFATRAKPVEPTSPVAGALDPGTPVAWIAELDAAERTWLLTPDLAFVPRDRVRRAIVPGFHGGEPKTGDRAVLVVGKPRAKYRMARYGWLQPSDERWPLGAVVSLDDDVKRERGAEFFETREPATYARASDVTVLRGSAGGAYGVPPGARWIEIDVGHEAMLLHDGDRIAWATLVSVGASDTPRGTFRVFAKHLTLARPFERPASGFRAEVPDVLLARDADGRVVTLSAAWWTETFGAPKGTAGVALAPIDARKTFDFAPPELPEGWHSVEGEGAFVVIHD